jgi:hypothetical protein
VKYWLRILQIDKKKLIRGCYVWQISNLKFGTWAIKLSEELDKIELGCVFGKTHRRRGWDM